VKRSTIVAGLVALRRAQERRVYETLLHREADVRRSERRLDAAGCALADQRKRARSEELGLVGSLVGRSVSAAAIARLQADLDAMTAETARLRDLEQRAQAAARDSRLAFAAARDDFRGRERAVAKLGRVVEEETRKAVRREVALAETALEEQASIGAGPDRRTT
jgi:hypothetical protein